MIDWAPKARPWPDPEAAAADRQRRTANALDMWRQAERAGPESALAVYLWSRLLMVDTVPPVLRLLRGARHRESGTRWPAMLALVEHAERGPVAVHLSYLAPDGSGKAHVDPVRRTIGPVAGAAVRLGALAPGLPLVLAEGIETALACQISTNWPAWACLSAHGLAAIALPAAALRIVIAADNDAAGLTATARLAARLRAEARTVKIATPPTPGSDWADVLALRAPGVRRAG